MLQSVIGCCLLVSFAIGKFKSCHLKFKLSCASKILFRTSNVENKLMVHFFFFL